MPCKDGREGVWDEEKARHHHAIEALIERMRARERARDSFLAEYDAECAKHRNRIDNIDHRGDPEDASRPPSRPLSAFRDAIHPKEETE